MCPFKFAQFFLQACLSSPSSSPSLALPLMIAACPMPCDVLPAFPGSHCTCASVPCHPATGSRVLERSNMNGVYVCGERERTREKERERLLARFLCQSLGACLQNAHTQFFSLLHPLMACTHKDTTCCHLRDGPDAHVVWRPVCSPVTNFPPLLWRYLTMPSWCVIVN